MQHCKKLLKIAPGLGEISKAPIDALKCLAGNPTGTTAHQFTNSEGNFHCGVWHSDNGKWKISYSEDEFCYMIAGKAVITDADGLATEVVQGDAFVLPAGFEGSWETVTLAQKFYAIYEK